MGTQEGEGSAGCWAVPPPPFCPAGPDGRSLGSSGASLSVGQGELQGLQGLVQNEASLLKMPCMLLKVLFCSILTTPSERRQMTSSSSTLQMWELKPQRLNHRTTVGEGGQQ